MLGRWASTEAGRGSLRQIRAEEMMWNKFDMFFGTFLIAFAVRSGQTALPRTSFPDGEAVWGAGFLMKM